MLFKVCHYTAGDDVLLQLTTDASQWYWSVITGLEPVSFFENEGHICCLPVLWYLPKCKIPLEYYGEDGGNDVR